MLRHQIPNGGIAEVIDRALTALLAELARQRFAATESPRPGKPAAPRSRHIPAAVKRAVWVRDLGRCTFVAENGKRCTATGSLEFHHVQPYATGGEATVSNVVLMCRCHNQHEGALAFPAPTVLEESPAYRAARGNDSSRNEFLPSGSRLSFYPP